MRRRVGDRSTVQPHHSPPGRPQPADHPQHGRLTRPVGPQQGQGLASGHFERHVEEHLDGPVGEVHVVDLEHRGRSTTAGPSPLLLLFLEELLHVQRQVTAEELGAPVHDPATDDRRREGQHDHRDPWAPGVGEHERDQSATGGSHEEDVEGHQG